MAVYKFTGKYKVYKGFEVINFVLTEGEPMRD